MPYATSITHAWSLDEANGNRGDSVAGEVLAPNVARAGTTAKHNNGFAGQRDLAPGMSNIFLSGTSSNHVGLTNGGVTYALWWKIVDLMNVGDFIQVADSNPSTSNNFTFSAFYNWGGSGNQLTLSMSTADGGPSPSFSSYGTPLVADTWYFLAFGAKQEAGDLKAFISVNGAPKSEGTFAGQGIYHTTGKLSLAGVNQDYGPGQGSMVQVDEFYRFAEYLPDADIATLFNSGAGRFYPFASGGGGGSPPCARVTSRFGLGV